MAQTGKKSQRWSNIQFYFYIKIGAELQIVPHGNTPIDLLINIMRCDLTRPAALELIKTAIEKAGFTDKVVIGMDVAASEFFMEGKYDLDFKSPPNAARNISGEELAGIYQGFINNYPGPSVRSVTVWLLLLRPY